MLAAGQRSSLNRADLSIAVAPPPNLEVQGARGGRLVSVTKAPFGAVARLEASALDATRVATEIVLFDGQKKIAITNRVQYARGGGTRYFAFPFAMERLEFRYEIQNGVVNPAKDVLPGGGKECFPVQHWAVGEQDDVTAAAVPIDSALVTFGDIARYRWPTEFGPHKGAIFSYVARETDQELMFQDLTFRYVVTSGHKLTPGVLSRPGWDAMTPFELNEIIAQDKVDDPPRPLDRTQGSFLEVDHPGVVLLTWKQAEDEKGTILRFVETNGQSGTVKVMSLVLNLERAWLCNSVEENQRPLTVSPGGFSFDVKPFGIITVRLEGTARLKQ